MYTKNQIIELVISDLGSEGEGIGKIDGFTFFVKNALPGDRIEARVLKVKKNYGFAKVERVIKPSSFRIETPCDIAAKCGGCQIMNMTYERQLEFKNAKVRNNLIRIGGIDEAYLDSILEEPVGMEPEKGYEVPVRYRNKAQYPIGVNRDGKMIAGFYAGHTHSIMEADDCYLGSPDNKVILKAMLDYFEQNHISAYDEKTGKGLIRHVLIRTAYAYKEIMVCVVINGKTLPKSEGLIEKLLALKLDGTIKSISISPNMDNTNVIMGNTFEVLYGQGYITDKIGDVDFRISPLSFFQVNPVQTVKLYNQALEYADLKGTETVWDLYCGIGTISLFLAGRAGRVCGVEIIPQAIANAIENAKINNKDNAFFYVGKAEEVLPAFYEGQDMKPYILDGTESIRTDREDFLSPDVIVVDPPRKGCDEACLETMVRMNPERIVYVSCDSATLARDVKYLYENGYKLKKARAYDLFPNTVHCEAVCLLAK